MHKVYYSSSKNEDPFVSSIIAEFGSEVEAIQFALALHQASNIPHMIEVFCDKGLGCPAECTLSSEKEDK